MKRYGLQGEVVLSLAMVMFAATAVFAAVLLQHGEVRLRHVLGKALLAEARASPGVLEGVVPGTRWWQIRGTQVRSISAGTTALDAETRALADRVRASGRPLLQPGAPWDPIRFAAPAAGADTVLAARLPASASWQLRGAPLLVAFGVLLADVVIFTAFGASVLRRRVVGPLERLAVAARSVADGALEAQVPVEGAREAEELARAFNEMTAALAGRTRALETAVAELRDTNRELGRTQAGLARAERLAAVGRLAAGVAHEVGNPIAALLALLDLASRDPALGTETRVHLRKAAKQGDRVRRILRQLLEFSRPARLVRVPVNLGAAASETVSLVAAQRRYSGVRFDVESEQTAPDAAADPGGVSQVLLNLIVNAADAARESADPRVFVRVRAAPLSTRRGDRSSDASAGRDAPDGVECVVADSGCGISEEDRERIFDPFFTTKAPGEGTGLGLATSLRLAEELGGRLELVAAPAGAKTAFALRLRAWQPDASGSPRSGSYAAGCGVRTEVRGA